MQWLLLTQAATAACSGCYCTPGRCFCTLRLLLHIQAVAECPGCCCTPSASRCYAAMLLLHAKPCEESCCMIWLLIHKGCCCTPWLLCTFGCCCTLQCTLHSLSCCCGAFRLLLHALAAPQSAEQPGCLSTTLLLWQQPEAAAVPHYAAEPTDFSA